MGRVPQLQGQGAVVGELCQRARARQQPEGQPHTQARQKLGHLLQAVKQLLCAQPLIVTPHLGLSSSSTSCSPFCPVSETGAGGERQLASGWA